VWGELVHGQGGARVCLCGEGVWEEENETGEEREEVRENQREEEKDVESEGGGERKVRVRVRVRVMMIVMATMIAMVMVMVMVMVRADAPVQACIERLHFCYPPSITRTVIQDRGEQSRISLFLVDGSDRAQTQLTVILFQISVSRVLFYVLITFRFSSSSSQTSPTLRELLLEEGSRNSRRIPTATTA